MTAFATAIVSVETLAEQLGAPDLVVVDCRFDLADTERGRRDYAAGHIPGAVYAHLDRDLSGPIVPGETGRHPLPAVEAIAAKLGAWGIGPGVQVVAYDDKGGAIAARLWWMLRWLGHEAVAVLDGGWPAWLAAGGPVETDAVRPEPRKFVAAPRPEMIVDARQVAEMAGSPHHRVLDARGPERYRGDVEPIDRVGGHIPGAILAPFADNVDESGRFRSPDQLRARFESLLGGLSPEQAATYCGSGVTAAHNVLAMAHAGMEGLRLYAGSWSEWIVDPERPIATGDEAG